MGDVGDRVRRRYRAAFWACKCRTVVEVIRIDETLGHKGGQGGPHLRGVGGTVAVDNEARRSDTTESGTGVGKAL